MRVLFLSKSADPVAWGKAIKAHLPALDIRVWPETGPVEAIDAALVSPPFPRGELKRYPNLKLVASLWAGVEKLLAEPDLPDVPITKMVDPDMTAGMTEYVVAGVLDWHCEFPKYRALQRARRWDQGFRPPAAARRIGLLGLGELGGDAARALLSFGFQVAGWSRTPKSIAGVESFAGLDRLPAFLARTDCLVCLLPLTADTTGILNAATLAHLPRGAYLINAARGGHMVASDVIAALDSGQLSGAMLDVFTPEPLPADDPLWTHPKVFVTPHVASLTNPETAALQVVENLRRLADGRPFVNVVGRARGY